MGKSKKQEMSKAEVLAAERIQNANNSVAEQGDPLRLKGGGRKKRKTQLGEPVIEREGKAAEGWDKRDLAAGGGRTQARQKLPSMDPERRAEVITELLDQYGVDVLSREQISELLVRKMSQLDRAMTDGEHKALHWYLFVNQRRVRGVMKAPSYGAPVQGSRRDSVPVNDRRMRDAACFEYIHERLSMPHQELLDLLTWMQYPEAFAYAERTPPDSRELGCKIIMSNDKRAGNAGFAGYFRAVSQQISELMVDWRTEYDRAQRAQKEREEKARQRRALGID
ncbi:MAG: hypothetical protein ACLFPA_12570 [Dichotomicrobium sp.]